MCMFSALRTALGAWRWWMLEPELRMKKQTKIFYWSLYFLLRPIQRKQFLRAFDMLFSAIFSFPPPIPLKWIKTKLGGFPGGPVDKNLPCTRRDISLTLIRKDSMSCEPTKLMQHSYWARALKPQTTTSEPRCCICGSLNAEDLRSSQKRLHNEAPALQLDSSPHSP